MPFAGAVTRGVGVAVRVGVGGKEGVGVGMWRGGVVSVGDGVGEGRMGRGAQAARRNSDSRSNLCGKETTGLRTVLRNTLLAYDFA